MKLLANFIVEIVTAARRLTRSADVCLGQRSGSFFCSYGASARPASFALVPKNRVREYMAIAISSAAMALQGFRRSRCGVFSRGRSVCALVVM